MTNEERESALHTGFLLGWRVTMEAYEISVPASDERAWDLLQEIADGETTIISSPAEWERAHPDMPAAMRKMIEAFPQMMAHDREVASAILRSFRQQFPLPGEQG